MVKVIEESIENRMFYHPIGVLAQETRGPVTLGVRRTGHLLK